MNLIDTKIKKIILKSKECGRCFERSQGGWTEVDQNQSWIDTYPETTQEIAKKLDENESKQLQVDKELMRAIEDYFSHLEESAFDETIPVFTYTL